MNKQIDLSRVEAAAREEWQHDPQLRAEFDNDVETYIAYRRADAMGLARIYGGRVAGGKEGA